MSTLCNDLSFHMEWDIQKKSCMMPFPMDIFYGHRLATVYEKGAWLHATCTQQEHRQYTPGPGNSLVGFPLRVMK